MKERELVTPGNAKEKLLGAFPPKNLENCCLHHIAKKD
jgi:hypothetical protein